MRGAAIIAAAGLALAVIFMADAKDARDAQAVRGAPPVQVGIGPPMRVPGSDLVQIRFTAQRGAARGPLDVTFNLHRGTAPPARVRLTLRAGEQRATVTLGGICRRGPVRESDLYFFYGWARWSAGHQRGGESGPEGRVLCEGGVGVP